MKIIKDYERYEPVLMTEIMRMLFMYKNRTQYTGNQSEAFQGRSVPRDAFLLNTEADTFIHLKVIPCRKGLI